MLRTVLIVLLLIWALGFFFRIAGGLIHLLLLVFLILLILQLVQGRRVV
jgi:hypothetical protein